MYTNLMPKKNMDCPKTVADRYPFSTTRVIANDANRDSGTTLLPLCNLFSSTLLNESCSLKFPLKVRKTPPSSTGPQTLDFPPDRQRHRVQQQAPEHSLGTGTCPAPAPSEDSWSCGKREACNRKYENPESRFLSKAREKEREIGWMDGFTASGSPPVRKEQH